MTITKAENFKSFFSPLLPILNLRLSEILKSYPGLGAADLIICINELFVIPNQWWICLGSWCLSASMTTLGALCASLNWAQENPTNSHFRVFSVSLQLLSTFGTGFNLSLFIQQYVLLYTYKCAQNDPRLLSQMWSSDLALTTASVRWEARPFYTHMEAEVKWLLPRSPAGVARIGTCGSGF